MKPAHHRLLTPGAVPGCGESAARVPASTIAPRLLREPQRQVGLRLPDRRYRAEGLGRSHRGALLPESLLSGVNRQLQPGEYLHYRRSFPRPAVGSGERVILHFGAVDQWCRVRMNGHVVGENRGGYLPFFFDVTEHLREGDNDLHVVVTDPSDTGPGSRGKQRLQPGGIWYTAQSGSGRPSGSNVSLLLISPR